MLSQNDMRVQVSRFAQLPLTWTRVMREADTAARRCHEEDAPAMDQERLRRRAERMAAYHAGRNASAGAAPPSANPRGSVSVAPSLADGSIFGSAHGGSGFGGALDSASGATWGSGTGRRSDAGASSIAESEVSGWDAPDGGHGHGWAGAGAGAPSASSVASLAASARRPAAAPTSGDRTHGRSPHRTMTPRPGGYQPSGFTTPQPPPPPFVGGHHNSSSQSERARGTRREDDGSSRADFFPSPPFGASPVHQQQRGHTPFVIGKAPVANLAPFDGKPREIPPASAYYGHGGSGASAHFPTPTLSAFPPSS